MVLLLWIIYVSSVLCLLCFRAHLLIDALWSPAGKRLTAWLSFVMSNHEYVTFPLVSCVRCDTRFYRFLICALFLSLSNCRVFYSQPCGHREWLTLGSFMSDVFACLYHVPYGVLGQVLYLIVSRTDHCCLPYFENQPNLQSSPVKHRQCLL